MTLILFHDAEISAAAVGPVPRRPPHVERQDLYVWWTAATRFVDKDLCVGGAVCRRDCGARLPTY